jgi:thioredoxin 1
MGATVSFSMADRPARAGGDSGAVHHVETESTFRELLSSGETVFVDFYAEWCGPCRMMESIVAELAAETDATVAKVDVDDLPPVAAEYDVRSIPAFVVFEDGEPVERLVGMQEKADLRDALA